MTVIKYKVSGLTCGGCVKRVQTTLSDFAEKVEVTLSPPELKITNPTEDMKALNRTLSQLGSYKLSAIDTGKNITAATPEMQNNKSWLITYKPLLLVFGFILISTLAIEVSHSSFVLSRWMQHFMAGFFLVFSFFKMLDLPDFASSYAVYDLLAKKWKSYGFIYPFLELGLGLAYLMQWQPIFTNWATFTVMSFSTIGVTLAVMKKQTIKCACLGTGFNLPMSTVTIVEDVLMATMALAMLII